ncbi:MAG: 23S rRNA (adenine(2503)-C(2))-methyltransferase RlmN [Deltaproteobacteria bacterium]|nr:23S rRNA (adenine(2503)-C(2))-methyltransferase RlmN [Deltaproteobacteria bacterium]
MRQNILDLTLDRLSSWCSERELKRYVPPQVYQWLYSKKVVSFEEMTNIAVETRALFAEYFYIGRLEVGARHHSQVDQSRKYLFRLQDGRSIESVLMPQKNRLTLCVSSQVGCAMGCKFCKTAEMKLVRNLTQGEILGQILEVWRELSPGTRISNIVLMGMGEPLHNYDNLLSSIRIMTDDRGLGISQRKITVSTVGLAPEIERFANDSGVKLALSLNATTEEGRQNLMPITKKYSLERVIEACKKYTELQPKRRVTLEYVMMAGINDSLEDAKRLARIGSHIPCKINLIPYNEYPASPFQRPSEEKVGLFFHYLADRHFQVNIRYSKGLDVMGACGQLCVNPGTPSPVTT